MRLTIYPVRIFYVWGMVALAIVIYAMVWYTFGMMIMQYIEIVEAQANFTGMTKSVSTVFKAVIQWHPFIALTGWVIWGFLNSLRKGKFEGYAT